MRKPAIGILAGMGPRSTAPFIDMVVDECQIQYGAKYDADFPAMMIYALPTPFRVDRPVDHDVLKAAIRGGLRELEQTGVDFVAMPCNVAHMYYDELRRSIGVPLLNIVEETVRRVPEGCKKAALFSTAAIMDAGIYQRGITDAGLECIALPNRQGDVDALISSVKAGADTETIQTAMAALLDEAGRLGAGCAVIGCTDLTPVARRCRAGLPVVDSAQCLARAVVAKFLELKDREGLL